MKLLAFTASPFLTKLHKSMRYQRYFARDETYTGQLDLSVRNDAGSNSDYVIGGQNSRK